ncbi:MAG TPA: mandelate racemase/muconate lactonizing enzyme family protein [Chryseosolibacter sp.]|nr:mandelate racemase/muconate lactonizing enzyme family protein [Chryseosolibacter sp.]
MDQENRKPILDRRSLLKSLTLGAGSGLLGIFGANPVSAHPKSQKIQAGYVADAMRITKVESVRFSDKINVGGGSGGSGKAEFCWVRLHTDTGIVGTGETYPFSNGELAALKDYSRLLIGRDPRDIDGIWKRVYHDMSMRNAGGADMRILSAINMAQLDILGKSAGVPVYRLLGGKTRPKVKVYNTTTDYWAINNTKMGRDTEKIVRFLLDRGIKGMKIYPFSSKDDYITSEEIDRCVLWLKQIRDTAGNEMEILLDCWGRFDLPSSQRILKAVEPYNVIHMEDMMIPSNSQQAYSILAAESSVPIAHSETVATRYEIKDFLESRAMDILMYDLCWCGGVTEAKKMSDMADAYQVPTSPHTAGGPLLWLSSIHLCTSVANFSYMESNYWKYTHQYPYFLNNVPVPVDGYVTAPETPGLGAEIRGEIFKNKDALVETVAQM